MHLKRVAKRLGAIFNYCQSRRSQSESEVNHFTLDLTLTEALKYEKDTLKEFIGFKYNPLISFNGKKECLKFICLNNVIKVLLARNGQRVSSLIAGIAY